MPSEMPEKNDDRQSTDKSIRRFRLFFLTFCFPYFQSGENIWHPVQISRVSLLRIVVLYVTGRAILSVMPQRPLYQIKRLLQFLGDLSC